MFENITSFIDFKYKEKFLLIKFIFVSADIYINMIYSFDYKKKERPFLLRELTASSAFLNDESINNYKSCPSVASFIAFDKEQELLRCQQIKYFEHKNYFIENENQFYYKSFILNESKNDCSFDFNNRMMEITYPTEVSTVIDKTNSNFDDSSERIIDKKIKAEISKKNNILIPGVTLIDLASTRTLQMNHSNFTMKKLKKKSRKTPENRKSPDLIGEKIKLLEPERGQYIFFNKALPKKNLLLAYNYSILVSFVE